MSTISPDPTDRIAARLAEMGVRTKLVNNCMSSTLNTLTSEARVFAEATGLEVMRTVKVLAGTTAGKAADRRL